MPSEFLDIPRKPLKFVNYWSTRVIDFKNHKHEVSTEVDGGD